MKIKRVILIIVIFVLSNCEIKIQEAKAQSNSFNYVYNKEIIVVDEMEYLLLYVKDNTSQTGYGVSVVNLTKDKLEVELLRKQLTDTVKIQK